MAGSLVEVLRLCSGISSEALRLSNTLLFDKVIGFRGVVEGVGCSTVVQNVAIALSSKTDYNICVIDTNMLYPMQYTLLKATNASVTSDWFDFAGDLSAVISKSSIYSNLYVLGFKNRGVTDILSVKDNESMVSALLKEAKAFFDVILFDLGHELTAVNVHSMLSCNKIYNVIDPSVKSVLGLNASMTEMLTLGVAKQKCERTIINKRIQNLETGLEGVLKRVGLTPIGSIPLSKEIAITGFTGKRLWGINTRSYEVNTFSTVIDSIVDEITGKAILPERNLKTNRDVEAELLEIANKEQEYNDLGADAYAAKTKPSKSPDTLGMVEFIEEEPAEDADEEPEASDEGSAEDSAEADPDKAFEDVKVLGGISGGTEKPVKFKSLFKPKKGKAIVEPAEDIVESIEPVVAEGIIESIEPEEPAKPVKIKSKVAMVAPDVSSIVSALGGILEAEDEALALESTLVDADDEIVEVEEDLFVKEENSDSVVNPDVEDWSLALGLDVEAFGDDFEEDTDEEDAEEESLEDDSEEYDYDSDDADDAEEDEDYAEDDTEGYEENADLINSIDVVGYEEEDDALDIFDDTTDDSPTGGIEETEISEVLSPEDKVVFDPHPFTGVFNKDKLKGGRK